MPPGAVETLRTVNENLRATLIRLRPDQTHCLNIQPQDFENILGEITRAEACLKLPNDGLEISLATRQETDVYAGNLKRLQLLLPDLYIRLMAEKSRLERARAELVAKASWANADH